MVRDVRQAPKEDETMSRFQKATRKKAKLRLALLGPSGAGKTWTALTIARGLGKRIAVIDSERGSASLYAGDAADFDVLELETFSPRTYVEAIKDAEREGYDVIVVDSLTHAWSGKGGALEMVDNVSKRSQSGNSFNAWREVTPEHNALVDAMLMCKAHLIATLRVKTEYVLEEDHRGKKVPKKVGMQPIQRDGLEYEFTLVADMNLQHELIVTKTRCKLFDNAVIPRPDGEVAKKLLGWLESGEETSERPLAEPASAGATTTPTAPTTAVSSASPKSADTRPATTDQLPTDIAGWLARHNGLMDRAFEKAGIMAEDADQFGLHAPKLPMPVFGNEAKIHAGKRYDEVSGGTLRELFYVKPDFDKRPANVRLHVSHLVARHEIAKLRNAAEAAAAEVALSALSTEAAQ
jgi:hypothetical protein